MSDPRKHDDDGFPDLDDTLADGPAPADVPDEARDWLAEQRTMHGLLRALHTADAASREDRVASILASIDADSSRGQRRHWFAVAAAALVLATVGVWLALPPSLPTAEAAIERAADEMGRQVDRRFHVRLTVPGRLRAERVRHDFDVVTRPGMRFLVEGRFAFAGVKVAKGRIGSDGETLWFSAADGRTRRSGPLADRERLLQGLGPLLEVGLDVGYLDVHALVARLPGDFRLRTVGRTTDQNGNPQLRIEAKRRLRRGLLKVRSLELLVDEASGLVTSLEADLLVVGTGRRHLVVEYLGTAEPGSVDYSRPW
jgi:hypothetical protein